MDNHPTTKLVDPASEAGAELLDQLQARLLEAQSILERLQDDTDVFYMERSVGDLAVRLDDWRIEYGY
jgi:hypothetical protein